MKNAQIELLLYKANKRHVNRFLQIKNLQNTKSSETQSNVKHIHHASFIWQVMNIFKKFNID